MVKKEARDETNNKLAPYGTEGRLFTTAF